MSSTVPIDTPDHQRGVVSAQSLLASVASGVASVDVSIPPNVETLIVVIPNNAVDSSVTVTGTTTGLVYAGAVGSYNAAVEATPTYYFDVSAAVDPMVTVAASITPGQGWYVYGDAGVHIVADVSKRTSFAGISYTSLAAATDNADEAPPYELVAWPVAVSTTAVVVPRPGLTARYRVFGFQLSATVAGDGGTLSDDVSGNIFGAVIGVGNVAMTFYPSGIALETNAGINWTIIGSGAITRGVILTVAEAI